MREFYLDNMLLGMKPFSTVHRYGVNGKIAGNLAAVHELKSAVPVLYGPKGCCFHYRYSARARNTNYPELESLDLLNKDVIFGASERLGSLLKEIDARERPELIIILPTVVSDIIYDDIEGAVRQVQPQLQAKVVAVKSQAFSHMDRNNTQKLLKEKAAQGCKSRVSGSAVYPGCGYVEVMEALVEQVMEPQSLQPKTVNIESFIWGYDGAQKLKAISKLLAKAGIKVNTLLPAASLKSIVRAPAAELNIVRRKKWALAMEKKFATPYFHIGDMQAWQGLEGIRDFYLTIGRALRVEDAMSKALAQEEARIMPEYQRLREKFSQHSCCLISGSLAALPEQVAYYYGELGLRLDTICLKINPAFQREAGLDNATMANFYDRIDKALAALDCKARVLLNPDWEQLREAAQASELLICGPNPDYAKLGRPIIPSSLNRPVFDYDSLLDIFLELQEILQGAKDKEPLDLLLNKLDFDPVLYPLEAQDINSKAAREMYVRMWWMRRK